MRVFDTARAFDNFRTYVVHQSRYMLDATSTKFLESVRKSSEDRRRDFPKGRILWRAQHGHAWDVIQQGDEQFEVPGPHPPTRMRPRSDRATEGRINPKGIPCLYLASDKETAMAEVRPAVGSYVSVGQFKTLRDLKLIDCSIGHSASLKIYFEEPDDQEKERAVWNDIDRAFSAPVSNADSSAEYAPTQILSELFKQQGYDGIAYKSHLGKGLNVAIFYLDAADLINCMLFEVKSVKFDFQEASNPYFVSKYYESLQQSTDAD